MTETITIERMGYSAEAVGHRGDGKTVFVAGGALDAAANVRAFLEAMRAYEEKK